MYEGDEKYQELLHYCIQHKDEIDDVKFQQFLTDKDTGSTGMNIIFFVVLLGFFIGNLIKVFNKKEGNDNE